ncbi:MULTISPECIES: DoxX family protein [Microbulbifer]|uniref:DoxX family protein n=1 Tax=Microbulbifer agarilyticus TaxID=260552 RepID=A0A1Q2MAC2_9GAMM|nr:DoxX family protein [Microbulbifer agarilyticus]AQQ69237.1 DoxX family protein [Microbulbifer agarilyticus]MBY6190873.1 DoxX family protein [Microbulbifer agarilyticus]MBY6211480.1 DoxX family protein [Microbulbifer agarilyticus]MCA0893502.1 DoxX family protein [Microbulbifer agarilyticus]MCA0900110.1 DoxX family protein [Microbulbifer agarilyticus]
MQNGALCDFGKLIGRILISVMFIVAGYSKIGAYAGTQEYMAAAGVPGILLPLVILLELGGGLAILFGFFTRWVALAFAVFCALSAWLFHNVPGDQMQQIMFMKNITIAGGFLILACAGAGKFSFDHAMAKVKNR